MCADSSYQKSSSPQSSTEVASLKVNRLKNKEALERRLQCRRTIKELINQGILINPSISNPDKVKQLQRAKVSDLLKQKIEKRPDRQSLINQRIIRDDKPGTSPYILEQCHNLEKNSLKNSLKSKLNARPGSLELIEKGVLQVDPGVASLVREGSIKYPRVEPVPAIDDADLLNPLLTACGKSLDPSFPTRLQSIQQVRQPNVKQPSTSSGRSTMKDETVVYKLGSLVFHNYRPRSSQLTVPNLSTNTSFQQRQKAREAQQAEMLRLQATASINRLSLENESNSNQYSIQSNSCSSVFPPSINSADFPMGSPDGGTPTPPETSQPPVSSFSPSGSSEQPSPLSASSVFSPSLADSPSNLKSLEHLSCVRLRAECQERNLPRSGNKAALIRQLEPFRDEILAKYFRVRKDVPPVFVPSSSCATSVQNSVSPLVAPSIAPGSWNTAYPLNFQTLTPLSAFPALRLSNPTVLNVPSGLRHSNSAPFIVDASQCITTSVQDPNAQIRGLLFSGLPSNVVVPGLSAPQSFLTDGVSNNGNDLMTVLLPYSDPKLIPPNTVYLASNRLSITQQSAVLSCSTPVNVNQSRPDAPLSATDPPAHGPPLLDPQLSVRSLPCSSDQSCTNTSDAFPNAGESTASVSEASGFAPSLGQIEEVWLQVRKLRRQIGKDTAPDASGNEVHSDVSSHVQAAQRLRLKQEHDRLVILCRLLVIDRLDALDDLADSNLDSSSSDSAIQAGCPTSQLQLERNLLLSYLHKLGGEAFVERVAFPSRRQRRSSSPVFDQTHTGEAIAPHETARPCYTSRQNASFSVSSIPHSMDHKSVSSAFGPAIHQASSWSGGLQQNIHNGLVVTNASQSNSLDNPSEPPASPLNTDALFELWHSLLKDSPSPTSTKDLPSSIDHLSPECSLPSGCVDFTLHPNCFNSRPSVSSNDVIMQPSETNVENVPSIVQSSADCPMLNSCHPDNDRYHSRESQSTASFLASHPLHGSVYYPQPFPYSFTSSGAPVSVPSPGKHFRSPPVYSHWDGNLDISSKLPPDQMADALYGSLTDFMDVSEGAMDSLVHNPD